LNIDIFDINKELSIIIVIPIRSNILPVHAKRDFKEKTSLVSPIRYY